MTPQLRAALRCIPLCIVIFACRERVISAAISLFIDLSDIPLLAYQFLYFIENTEKMGILFDDVDLVAPKIVLEPLTFQAVNRPK